MPQYVIEREIPGAGTLTAQELSDISTTSNDVLAGMGGRATWLHSYVTDDKIYCIYEAADTDAVLEHARLGNFPANVVTPLHTVIDPSTAK